MAAAQLASILLDALIVLYVVFDRILTYDGSKYAGNCFNAPCVDWNTEFSATTSHHSCTNGMKITYINTIIDKLRHDVSEQQNGWDDYVPPFTYRYNAQVYEKKSTTPFSLTSIPEQLGSADIVPRIVPDCTEDIMPHTLNQKILARINLLKTKTTITLQRAKQR